MDSFRETVDWLATMNRERLMFVLLLLLWVWTHRRCLATMRAAVLGRALAQSTGELAKAKDALPAVELFVKVAAEIDQNLAHVVRDCSVDKAALIQFHNGGRNVNGVPFLKASMTNEIVNPGVWTSMGYMRDLPVSVFAFWVEELATKSELHLTVDDRLRAEDRGVYAMLAEAGARYAYAVPVRSTSGAYVGFVLTLRYRSPAKLQASEARAAKDAAVRISALLEIDAIERVHDIRRQRESSSSHLTPVS